MTLRELCRPGWLLSSLLIVGSALFTIGVAAERHAVAHHTENGTETAAPATAPNGRRAATKAGTHTDETGGEGTTHTEPAAGETSGHPESSGETVLGLNLESNLLVIVAVAVSLALAALTWNRNRQNLMLATAVFAAVFAVFDIAEVAHQITESRTGLATLAGVIALVHLAAGLIAEQRATTAPA